MLKIGLTGGIGSGKSTVAGIFEVLGIPVYYSDDAAKRLMNEDPDLRQAITLEFGTDAYLRGRLNRPFIAAQVFRDKVKLDKLNALIHPATIRDGNLWMQRQKTAYAVKEAALIFESNVDQYLDYVVGVSAPENLRIQRTMERDAISREEVLSRMKNQMPEEEKMQRCDFIIYNDEQHAVLPQVIALHGRLMEIRNEGLMIS
ncbi:MAG TPA: dephospho-CoA kinase [Puia sp.]|nr:dephospho-CoA kinase [Puia sp.]